MYARPSLCLQYLEEALDRCKGRFAGGNHRAGRAMSLRRIDLRSAQDRLWLSRGKFRALSSNTSNSAGCLMFNMKYKGQDARHPASACRRDWPTEIARRLRIGRA